MARERERVGPDPVVPRTPEDDCDDSGEDPHEGYLRMFWYHRRDAAMSHIVESAAGCSPTVSAVVQEAAGRGTAGERSAAIMAGLAGLLASHDLTFRRQAARLLTVAFQPLGHLTMRSSPSAPEEYEAALPAILAAVAVPDSEMRLSLLSALRHLPYGRCASGIPSPVAEHLFPDGNPEVVLEALGLIMATGIDLASVTIPGIIGLLAHQDTRVRRSACQALAQFGVEANRALPELVDIVRADPDLRESAILALVGVDPDGQLVSNSLADQADREAFLSHLRAAGPRARDLRLQLQARWEPKGITETSSKPGATHSIDFRSVNWFGQVYTFNENQAACVKILWEHWERKTPAVSGATLLEQLELSTSRMSLLFRGHPAWRKMIDAVNRSRGAYTLNPPSDS